MIVLWAADEVLPQRGAPAMFRSFRRRHLGEIHRLLGLAHSPSCNGDTTPHLQQQPPRCRENSSRVFGRRLPKSRRSAKLQFEVARDTESRGHGAALPKWRVSPSLFRPALHSTHLFCHRRGADLAATLGAETRIDESALVRDGLAACEANAPAERCTLQPGCSRFTVAARHESHCDQAACNPIN